MRQRSCLGNKAAILWGGNSFFFLLWSAAMGKNTLGFLPFLFIILLIFSDDLEKKLFCGFKLLSSSRFLVTFPVCSSCCKSSSMLISNTLVSLLKHTLAWDSLNSFLYIFVENPTKCKNYFTGLLLKSYKRFLSFVKVTAFIFTSPIKLTVQLLATGQSHYTLDSAVRIAGSIISKMADDGNSLFGCRLFRKLKILTCVFLGTKYIF